MFLDATTKSLEIKLGGAVTTNQLPVTVSYVDISQSTFAVSAMSSTDTQSNGATAVTIVAAPGATTTRVPKRIWIRNADTVSATVTIQLNNNTTLRAEIVLTLLTGETLIYEDAAGWMAFDVNGNRKEVTSSVFSSLTVTGASTLAAVTTSGLGTFNAGISIPTGQSITGAGTASITGFASASLGAISGTTLALSGSSGTQTIVITGASSTTKGRLGQFANTSYLSSNWYYDGGAQQHDSGSLGSASIQLLSGATTTSSIAFGLSDAGAAGAPTYYMILTSTGLAVTGTQTNTGGWACNGNAAQTKQVSGGTLAGVITALTNCGILSS